MGLYPRADSPFWWMLCERPGQPPLKRSTKIPRDAPDAMSRKLQRQQAEDIYRAEMNKLARARYELPPNDPTTIAFDKYADWFDQHHLSRRRGAVRDRDALKHLRAFFGREDLATITRARVQEYITHRLHQRVKGTERTVSPRTVNREVDVLKGALREAVGLHLAINPLLGLKRLRVVKPPKRLLTPKEEARLLAELQPIDQAFYIVAVDTLLRLSNVINLRRADNHGTHLELLDSKTGAYSVPLSGRARKALASVPDAGPYYFTHRRVAKNPRDWRGAVRLMLQRACKRAGVPYGRASAGITFHTGTRATGATRMLRAGADPRTVQAVGNWADFRSMQEYLAVDRTLTRKAVDLIGRDVVTTELRRLDKDRKSVVRNT